jgi:hypothetical protein
VKGRVFSGGRIQFAWQMKRQMGLGIVCLALIGADGLAAERAWEMGTWAEVRTRRPRVVFGLQPSPNGPGRQTAPATTLVRTYVIETDVLRFELTDIAPASLRTVDAIVGEAVTFAVDKNTVYVRGPNGLEHRLRVTKKLKKPRAE